MLRFSLFDMCDKCGKENKRDNKNQEETSRASTDGYGHNSLINQLFSQLTRLFNGLFCQTNSPKPKHI